MKGDMDFDECQMRVLEMGVISQGLRAALKHCVSLVSTGVGLGSAALDSFVPVSRSVDRAGYGWLWRRSSPLSG